MFIQMLLGMHVMNRNKFLHRDLKPENIFVDKDENIKIGYPFLSFSLLFASLLFFFPFSSIFFCHFSSFYVNKAISGAERSWTRQTRRRRRP
jgi:serine/threonine protein kinase